MKNLETLIQELCPDGLEFVKLGDVGTFYGGLSGKSKADFTDGNAKFVTYMNVYSNPALNTDIKDFVKIEEGEKQNKVLYGDILFTGSSETPNECGMTSVLTEKTEEDLYLNSFCFGYRFNDIDEVNPGFMKHLFRSHMLRKALAKTASGVTRFNVSKKKVANIEIPLPPIEVQTEIVRILDKFTSLEAELEAELDCRKRQYEYYRDKLLSFDNEGGQEVEWKTLGELAEIGTGSSNTKDGLSEGLYPFYTRGQEVLRKNEYEFDDEAIITAGDGVGVGKVIHYVKGKYALHQRAYRFKPGDLLNARFLYFYMTSTFYKYVCGNSVSSSVSSLRKPRLLKYPIPLLPMQEQIRIVSILDRFESLTTSLQSGLPAEIAARRQQYEHYRDKLLTFKRKGAV